VRTWGGTGSDAGQLKCPHGIWCDTRDANNPQLVVADRSNVRLQYFTLDGKYVSTVTHELRHPCHFDQRNGELLIPDLHGRLTIFDRENNLVTHLGDNPDPKQRGNNGVPKEQLKPGIFCSPAPGDLGSRGEHLRRRVAQVRAGDEASTRVRA
jgi:hypothetical protein